MSVRIVQALTMACQFLSQSLPDAAIEEMAAELAAYPEADVLAALKRCRSELRVLRYGDILDRLPGQHPGAEEAWALVSRCLRNEQISLVWTDEMREAYGVAAALAEDAVAARMAFRETYARLVGQARAQRRTPVWSVSLGYDPHGRDVALAEAVRKNQISAAHAARLLPPAGPVAPAVHALIGEIRPMREPESVPS